MESLAHNYGNIAPTICTNMLIFSKDTLLVIDHSDDLNKSHKFTNFNLVTSHFPSLLIHEMLIVERFAKIEIFYKVKKGNLVNLLTKGQNEY